MDKATGGHNYETDDMETRNKHHNSYRFINQGRDTFM